MCSLMSFLTDLTQTNMKVKNKPFVFLQFWSLACILYTFLCILYPCWLSLIVQLTWTLFSLLVDYYQILLFRNYLNNKLEKSLFYRYTRVVQIDQCGLRALNAVHIIMYLHSIQVVRWIAVTLVHYMCLAWHSLLILRGGICLHQSSLVIILFWIFWNNCVGQYLRWLHFLTCVELFLSTLRLKLVSEEYIWVQENQEIFFLGFNFE